MARFKNAGLVFGLMVGFALTAQAARALKSYFRACLWSELRGGRGGPGGYERAEQRDGKDYFYACHPFTGSRDGEIGWCRPSSSSPSS